MEKPETEHFLTSDLQLQAFLQLMSPELFIGINKENSKKVIFVFYKNKTIMELVNGYQHWKEYSISPKALMDSLDQGKALIFGDYEL